MSKEKQIEEMANEINEMDEPNAHYYTKNMVMREAFADCFTIAKHLYNAGYRKQSEWISVEERLPKVDTDVLVITANGSFKVGRCNIYHNGTLVLWMTNDGLGERAITHWMPLPEAPKMKGGEE